MPVEDKTAAQFASELETDVLAQDATADTTTGPIPNVVIKPTSQTLQVQNSTIVRLFNLIRLYDPESLDPDDLDDFVWNEQILRSDGNYAIGTLIFSRAAIPTVNLPVPINEPIATEPDPETGASVIFVTAETKTLVAASAALYFNATTQMYELPVACVCTQAGSIGRVGAERVIRPLRSITGFDSVFNRAATTLGDDQETNTRLVDRYLIRILGTDLGGPYGVETSVLANFSNVTDVATVYGDDALMLRNATDAGAVDAWILGRTAQTATDNTPYLGLLQLISLDNQPVISVDSVSVGAVTYTEGTDWEFVLDTSNDSASNRAQDGIRFIVGGAAPALNATLDITYTYDGRPGALQTFYAEPEVYVFGRDLLFRASAEIDIAITGVLYVNLGDPDTVLAAVETAISSYINGLGEGDDVEEFDVNAEVAKIVGVDNLVFSLFAISGGAGVADIAIGRNEYPKISSTDLNIVLG